MPIIFFTIVVIEILAGAEVNLFTPSFPDIQRVFGLSVSEVELLLIANCVTYGLSCLIVGNLGDRYGTKFVILCGLGIFTIGSLFCIFATQYPDVLIGRMLQGIGVAGPAVLGYVVMAETYPIQEQQKLMGRLIGITTMVMAFAPLCGSYISLYFGWKGNFITLLSLGLFSLYLVALYLPRYDGNSNVRISCAEYLPLLASKKTLYYICTICFLSAPYWIFTGISPILYMRDMNVSLEMYGYYQGSLSLAFAVLCLYSSRMIDYFGARWCFYLGIYISILSVVFIAILGLLELKNPILITLALMTASCGVLFPINILYPISLSISGDAKGRMASIIQSLRLLMTALGLQLTSYYYNGTFYRISVILVITLLIGLYGSWMLDRQKYINWQK
jgi:DHA1 family bicyclomycin/chloramphenicol resistance-like MFS transporter